MAVVEVEVVNFQILLTLALALLVKDLAAVQDLRTLQVVEVEAPVALADRLQAQAMQDQAAKV
jgi:hypothetical protein